MFGADDGARAIGANDDATAVEVRGLHTWPFAERHRNRELPQAELGRDLTEAPQHIVTIAKPFAVSKFEVTFAEWDECAAQADCMAHVDDHGWGRDRQPVINVSWEDAQHYVHGSPRSPAKTYRLLTEAEYEFAARAGTQTAYPWGDEIGNNHANCASCGSRWDITQTAPVGSFAPNHFGLYDMVGNVWEWVEA